jgi:hypothetical protein
MVQYLRQTVDVENAIIVSPDAGGAKRCVLTFHPGGEPLGSSKSHAYLSLHSTHAELRPSLLSSISNSPSFIKSAKRQMRSLEWSWSVT